MKLIAKRRFISSRKGIGNVPEGRVFETDNDYANMLIKAGLAEKISADPALKAPGQPSFTSPVGANAGNGQSSQAVQASQNKTAPKSKTGVKKTKTAK